MNPITRRLLVSALALLPLAGAVPAAAQSDAIQVIVPYAPGGVLDTTTRLVVDAMSKKLNQTMIVVNKPGANGIVGTDYVAKSKPDGKTVAMIVAAHSINPALQNSLPYDTFKDLRGVAQVADIPMLVVSSAKLPVTSMPELVAYGKAHPGQLVLASSGVGSGAHLAAELFAQDVGITWNHVPYKGISQALPDLFTGQVQVIFDTFQTMAPHVAAGKIRALGVTGKERSATDPSVPTIAETVAPGYDAGSWIGMIAPAKTPDAVVNSYADALAAVLQSDEIKKKFAEFGLVPVGSRPEVFDAFILAENKKWSTLITEKGIKPE